MAGLRSGLFAWQSWMESSCVQLSWSPELKIWSQAHTSPQRWQTGRHTGHSPWQCPTWSKDVQSGCFSISFCVHASFPSYMSQPLPLYIHTYRKWKRITIKQQRMDMHEKLDVPVKWQYKTLSYGGGEGGRSLPMLQQEELLLRHVGILMGDCFTFPEC